MLPGRGYDLMNSQFIGSAGESLVAVVLKSRGISVAVPEPDNGVDLLAKINGVWQEIQIKTQFAPSPAGGSGKLSIGWSVPVNCPADIIAVVNLESFEVWFFSFEEYKELAQQKTGKYFKLYMFTDETVKTGKAKALKSQFEGYKTINQ